MISTSIDRRAETKDRARIDADSDRRAAAGSGGWSHRPARLLFRVDAVPGVGVLRRGDEVRRNGLAGRKRLAQRGQQGVVVRAVIHVARLLEW